MARLRSLHAILAVVAGIVGLAAACTPEETTESGTTSGHGSATHGSSAANGTGGGSSVTSSSITGGGGSPPLECSNYAVNVSNVPDGECNILNQTCEPGFRCEPALVNGSWTTQCVVASGLKGVGKPCNYQSECLAGLFCIQSQCIPACCRVTEEPCEGGQCNLEVSFNQAGEPQAFVYMCSFSPQCTLLEPGSCPPGTECHIEDPNQGLSVCSPPSQQQVDEGGMCQYLNDCHDNQNCTSENGTSVCRYYCYVSAGGVGTPGEGGCPAGQSCIPADLGVDDIGICRPN